MVYLALTQVCKWSQGVRCRGARGGKKGPVAHGSGGGGRGGKWHGGFGQAWLTCSVLVAELHAGITGCVQASSSANLDELLPLLTVSPYVSISNAANNLCKSEPALFAAFAHPTQKVSQQLAFICQAFLICFGF